MRGINGEDTAVFNLKFSVFSFQTFNAEDAENLATEDTENTEILLRNY